MLSVKNWNVDSLLTEWRKRGTSIADMPEVSQPVIFPESKRPVHTEMSQEYLQTHFPPLVSGGTAPASSDVKLTSWGNTDFLAYILKHDSKYKKEKWSKYNEAWNRYNALVLMADRAEISQGLSAVVRAPIFRAVVLSDDNTLATASARYGFPQVGGNRLALEVATTVYQKEGEISADDIAVVDRLDVELADALRQVF